MTSPKIWGGLDQDADVQAHDVDLVPVDQVPVRDRGFPARQAGDDDPAGHPLGRGQAGAQGHATGRLHNQVGARAVGQSQDLVGEVLRAGIEDVVGTESS